MDRLRSNRVPAELMRVDACQDAALVAMTLHLRERERVKAPSGACSWSLA
jgi:hypothetical protein